MIRRWIAVAVALSLVGCGEDPPASPGRFGEVTSAVVLVNPVINQGSTTSVATGGERSGVEFQAEDLTVATDSTGMALVEDLPTGTVTLDFDPGTYSFQVVREKELYDVVLAYRDGTVQPLFPPVRYPLGGEVVEVEPGESIAEAAASDDTIVLLKEGTYPGNLELRAEGVLIFGAWSPTRGPLSVIEGNVTVLGGGNRMRGVKVTGRLTSNANTFSAAFSDIASATITGNGVTLLRNRFTAGQATVPSSNAVLVDNTGIP
ncbi:hypothetical protein G4177_12465 [Corallococcus sp. ZKHCc1 1396]|uniref:Carboxypeptidase regulatory-like domain-containing protein n=1 Tax=Corallococcus soli TaxID=2710757 RepID=A0ABR9PM57_9BACT|nr:hypothetical protein [Corallococcus soli]MBE4748975.1 hypothetical protein [Corallococcus soli]